MKYIKIPVLLIAFGCAHINQAVPEVVLSDGSGDIEIIELNIGQEFKFKGLAIDIEKGKAYLGSYDEKEIVVVDLKSKKHELIKTPYSGRLNAMGVYLQENKLYAVMNEVNDDPKANPISVLVVIDIATHKVLHSYEAVGINGRHHFNHVVVDRNGVAYISNTLKSSIYTVDTNNLKDSLKKLVEHVDLSWVHGIDISPGDSTLFSTSYGGGIKFYNLKSRQFSSFRDTLTNVNDGLRYHKSNLYGIGGNSLKRYTLNESEDKVIKTDVLISDHQYFNDPRCIVIIDGWIYCLANIEFEPVYFDRGQENSIGKREFRDTYILKYKM